MPDHNVATLFEYQRHEFSSTLSLDKVVGSLHFGDLQSAISQPTSVPHNSSSCRNSRPCLPRHILSADRMVISERSICAGG